MHTLLVIVRRVFISAIVLATIVLNAAATVALAESPTPTPTPKSGPTATPKPAPTPTAAPAASGSPAPAPTSASAGPTPSSTVTADEAAAFEAARVAIEAATLLQRLEAMHRYMEAQLDALRAREEGLREDQERVAAQIAATEGLISSEQQRLDAIVRAAYRSSRTSPLEEILESGSLVDGIARTLELSRLGEEERHLVERLRTLRRDLDAQRSRLAADADELSRVTESLGAKHDALRTLVERARRIADAQRAGGDRARIAAEIDVVRELAAEQERASAQLQEVVRKLVPFVVQPSALWTWPSSGAISQPFGPSSLELEPPVEYQGIRYRHFHAALDLAAPLFSPVVAAADGRVAFVGHFTDGAMVVLIVHADGYLSLYAHLDDGMRPPIVRAGDDVQAGQIVGAIGLTGITTGPHLHFAVLQGNAPVDPRALLPTR